MVNLSVTEVNLSRGDKHEHPDIVLGETYLALIGGQLHLGRFEPAWFGLHFACGWGVSGGMQFDTPGTNSSRWEQLWKIDLA